MSRKKTNGLSNYARRKYIRCSGYDGCPYCKTKQNDLNMGSLESVEGGSIEQTISCPNCKKRWIDEFVLCDIRPLCDLPEEIDRVKMRQEREN